MCSTATRVFLNFYLEKTLINLKLSLLKKVWFVEKAINDRVVGMIVFVLRREVWGKCDNESFKHKNLISSWKSPGTPKSTRDIINRTLKTSRVFSSNAGFLGLQYQHLPLPTCVSSRFPYHFQYSPACVILSRAKPTLKTRKMLENAPNYSHIKYSKTSLRIMFTFHSLLDVKPAVSWSSKDSPICMRNQPIISSFPGETCKHTRMD